MIVTQIKNSKNYEAVPNYYLVYLGHIRKYYRTGNESSRVTAHHYARVAEEFGQAVIEVDDETTCTDIYPITAIKETYG